MGLDLDVGPVFSQRYPLFNAELVDLFNDSFALEQSYLSSFVLGGPAADTNFGDAIVGDDTSQILPGTDAAEVIAGLGGNDTIDAGDGHDTVFGGEGADSLIGGLGVDTADFGDLAFVLNTGGSYSLFEDGARIGVRMSAGNFDNQTSLGFDLEEVDVILHEATGQRDTIEEFERVRFTEYSDRLTYSTSAPDTTYTGPNHFEFLGGADYLAVQVTHENPPVDDVEFFMGDGDDTVIFNSLDLEGATHLSGWRVDGGDETDTLHVTGDFDLNTGAGPDGALFVNFENVTSIGNGANLTGDSADNFLIGSLGDDTLRGGAGDDTLYANIRAPGSDVSADDVDVLIGGAGADELRGYAGGTRTTVDYSDAETSVYIKYAGISGRGFRGEAQGDVLWNINGIRGSNFDDILISGTTDQVLEGGAGNDRLKAGSRGDQLFGGDGDDLLVQEDADRATDNRYYDGGAGFDIVAVDVVDPYSLTGTTSGTARFTYNAGSWGNVTKRTVDKSMSIDYTYRVTEYVRLFLDEQGDGSIQYLRKGVEGSERLTNYSGTAEYGNRPDATFWNPFRDTVIKTSNYDNSLPNWTVSRLDGVGFSFPKSGDNTNGSAYVRNVVDPVLRPEIYDNETVKNIEGLIGSQGNDLIVGNAQNNAFFGNGGNDKIIAGAGDDRLGFGEAQALSDVFSFPSGNGPLAPGGSTGPVYATLEAWLRNLNPNETNSNSNYDVPVGLIRKSASAVDEVGSFLWGQAGSDTLDMRFDRGISFFPDRSDQYAVVDLNIASANAPNNNFTNEQIEYGRASWYSAGGSELTYATTFGIENVIGSQNNDTIYGDDNDNVIQGLGGADIMYGEGGFDTLSYDLSTSGVGLLFNIFAGSAGAHVASSANGAAHPLANGFNGQFGDAQGDRGLGFERFVTTDYDDYILFATYPVTEEKRYDVDGTTLAAYFADREQGDDVSFFETGSGDDTFVSSGAYASNVDFGTGDDLLEIISGGGVTADMGAGDDVVTVTRSATALNAADGFFPISYSDASAPSALLNLLDGGTGQDRIVFDGPIDLLTLIDGKVIVERSEQVVPAAKVVDDVALSVALTDAELNALADQPSAPLSYELSNFEILQIGDRVIRLDSQDPVLGGDLNIAVQEDAIDPFDLGVSIAPDEQDLSFRVLATPLGAVIREEGAPSVQEGDILSAAQLDALLIQPMQSFGQAQEAFIFEPILDAEALEAYALLSGGLPEPRVVEIPLTPPLPGIALNLQRPEDPLGADLTITVTELPDLGAVVVMQPNEAMLNVGLTVLEPRALELGDTLSADQVTQLRFVADENASGAAGTFTYLADTGQGVTADVADTLDGDAGTLAALDGQASRSVTFTLEAVDDAPEVSRLLFPISPEGELRGVVPASDAEGDAFEVRLVDMPLLGSLDMQTDGSFLYLQSGDLDFGDSDFIDDFFTVRAVQIDGGDLTSGLRTQTIRIFKPEAIAPIVFDETNRDVYFEDDGAPVALGGLGTNDMIVGHSGKDKLFGFGGNDNLMGGDEDDELNGGDGDDTLEGGMGANRHTLGRGKDKVMGTPEELNEDVIADFEQGDAILVSGAGFQPSQVMVKPGSAIFEIDTDGDGVADTDFKLEGDFAGQSFEVIGVEGGSQIQLAGPGATQLGTSAEKFVAPDPGQNRVYGDKGDDAIITSGGDDILAGGAGDDRLIGGDGADTLLGGLGGDRMTGGDGADVFAFDASDFGDSLTADFITDFTPGEDRLELTGFGFDRLEDVPWSSTGTIDFINLGPGKIIVLEGISKADIGTDDINFGAFGKFYGLVSTVTVHQLSAFGDRFIANATNAGGATAVNVNAGAGDDFVLGAAGDDVLLGEDGGDVMIGGAGSDILQGGDGNNRLTGGTGADQFVFIAGEKTSGFSFDTITDFDPNELDVVAATGFDLGISDLVFGVNAVGNLMTALSPTQFLVFEGLTDESQLGPLQDAFDFG
ncbi:MAG: hypothetical protein AB8B71_05370 [Paracoccaceae bacterium]